MNVTDPKKMANLSRGSLLLLGVAGYVALLGLSLFFYKERTIFCDIAYHLFMILKDDTMAIQNYRFGSFFTQAFPLFASRLGLSLKVVTVLYSVSFVLMPLLTFLIILLGIKNTRIALAFLLSVFLMMTHTFFWIQSELPQGMCFLFIALAIIDNGLREGRFRWRRIIPILLLLPVAAFTHPLLLFAYFFTMAFYFVHFPSARRVLAFFGAFYIGVLVVKTAFFSTGYDSQAYGGLKNFLTYFPNYFKLDSVKNFARWLVLDYNLLVVGLAVLTVLYLKNRQYLKLLLCWVSFVGYALLVNVSYPNGAAQFYLENQYLILAFFVAIPMAYDFWPSVATLKVQNVLLAGILLVGVIRIFNAGTLYNHRLDWLRQLVETQAAQHGDKLILGHKDLPPTTILLQWSRSYEVWLLSTLEQGKTLSIVEEEHHGSLDWAVKGSTNFISAWGVYDYKDLNPKYFRFTDTTSEYKRVDEWEMPKF